MAFSYREYLEKEKRIVDMAEEGLNIPRFRYVQILAVRNQIDDVFKWAYEIHDNRPSQRFNIRTYNYAPHTEKETTSCPHLCDLRIRDLREKLPKLNMDYTCMVDAETPDDGRMAGTIIIHPNRITEVEFVTKEKRAMVRDINFGTNVRRLSSTADPRSLFYRDTWRKTFPNITYTESHVLASITKSIYRFYKKGIIFEWTYFKNPSGIFYDKVDTIENYIVFWEYRSAHEKKEV